MKIEKIIGEHGPMDALCANSACPAAVLTEGDTVFVQGYLPSEGEAAHLTAPKGEGFVRMPLSVFQKIAAQVK